MRIRVNLSVSESYSTWKFSLAELNYSEEEWKELSEDERREAIEEWVDGLPEQPYWTLDNFQEVE